MRIDFDYIDCYGDEPIHYRRYNAIIDAINAGIPKRAFPFESNSERACFESLETYAKDFEKEYGYKPLLDYLLGQSW